MSKKNVAAAVNNSAAIPTQSAGANISATMMRRISDLAIRREAWETAEYNRSNQALYSVIAECLNLYLDLTSGTDIKFKKQGLESFISSKGYGFKKSSPLSLKVIRCVFGDRDRRRLSTYHTVLLAAIADKWAVSSVAKHISECGGVQEISLRKPGGMSAKDKANAARDALINQSIATLSSDAIFKQFDKEHVAETAVAVMTLNNDGTYSVHCVVRSATAVNAALAGYFSANKEVLVGLQEQQKTQATEAEKAQVIANAAAAANDAQTELAA